MREHTTPHVFVPTTDECTVRYRCVMCGHSGRRTKTGIVADKKSKPVDHEYMTLGTCYEKPKLDAYDRRMAPNPALYAWTKWP